MNTITEHELHYTEHKSIAPNYDFTASCSCGWAHNARGVCRTDVQWQALASGIEHFSDSYFKSRKILQSVT